MASGLHYQVWVLEGSTGDNKAQLSGVWRLFPLALRIQDIDLRNPSRVPFGVLGPLLGQARLL